MDAFLRSSGMPSLSDAERTAMESPLSQTELQTALKQAPSGKAPGPDGLTPAYYKSFLSLLSPHFLTAYNALLRDTPIPADTLRSHIVVLPKPDKDLTQCGSYRPIALLNTDLKLFSKILANRLLPTLPRLIHFDQAGFIPAREARDNTTRLLNVIHQAKSRAVPLMLLSTDAEKAFDRVNWRFLRATLEHVGLGPSMLKWITALYSTPTAAINVNDARSDYFSLSNGTRQGCPLSPLIFDLVLEPLLCTIRASSVISGLTLPSGSHRVAAYADDLVFFITNPDSTLPALLDILQIYGDLSYYKINYTKSAALNISLPSPTVLRLQRLFPFKWENHCLKYLGTYITSDLDDLYEANYAPLLRQVARDLRQWRSLSLTWFGRCNSLKMTILPRILFLLQTLPIRLPLCFFRKLQTEFISFLWADGVPRIKRQLLHLPKTMGGLGLPDILTYYKATQLNRLLDWCVHQSTKRWVQMDRAVCRCPLEGLSWLSSEIPREIRNHPLLYHTVTLTRRLLRQTALSPFPSPLVPLIGDPDFQPGLDSGQLARLVPANKFRLTDFRADSKWLMGPGISSLVDPPLDYFSSMQIRHYLTAIPSPESIDRPFTVFEDLCRGNIPPRHAISTLYSLLISPSPDFVPPFLLKWESDLQHTLTPTQRHHVMSIAHKSSMANSYQESGYKLLTRWYRVPTLLHKIYNSVSPLCWRCNLHPGSLYHVFWACPKLKEFWAEVGRLVGQLTMVNLTDNPGACLLHVTNRSTPKYRTSLTVHLINAARACVPVLWKSTQPPTVRMWLAKVNDIYTMEDLTATLRNTEEKLYSVWSPWIFFRHSDCYLRHMVP